MKITYRAELSAKETLEVVSEEGNTQLALDNMNNILSQIGVDSLTGKIEKMEVKPETKTKSGSKTSE